MAVYVRDTGSGNAPAPKKAPAAKKAPAPAAPTAKKAPASAQPPPPPPPPPAPEPTPQPPPQPTYHPNALRIVRKPPVIVKSVQKKLEPIDTAKAVAFAMSIAKEMKRTAKDIDNKPIVSDIQLPDRPTSRAEDGSECVRFPDADLAEFRKRLLAAQEEAISGVDAIKATGFNESEDHEADGGDGTNQTLRLQALGQMGTINRTIQQIQEALHRIDDGTYGVCTMCGQLIRKPRLENQPFVLTCMECQNELEREGKVIRPAN